MMPTSVLKALPGKLDIKRHSPSVLYISASLAMSTSVLKALPGKLDIKSHSPCILYVLLLASVLALLSVSRNVNVLCYSLKTPLFSDPIIEWVHIGYNEMYRHRAS